LRQAEDRDETSRLTNLEAPSLATVSAKPVNELKVMRALQQPFFGMAT